MIQIYLFSRFSTVMEIEEATGFVLPFIWLPGQNFEETLSQYIREAYGHTERKGHPQIARKLEETVSIL